MLLIYSGTTSYPLFNPAPTLRAWGQAANLEDFLGFLLTDGLRFVLLVANTKHGLRRPGITYGQQSF